MTETQTFNSKKCWPWMHIYSRKGSTVLGISTEFRQCIFCGKIKKA